MSYNWRDQREVQALAEQLQTRGAKVFLDRWYLTPSKAWPQELERALSTCRAVAVCLGPGEMGPWQQRERNFALDRQAKDPHFPLIPILLPGADPALSFLSQNTWIDLRAGVAQPLLIEVLLRVLHGEPPGPELQERLKETLTHISPYKGLAFFREEDAPFFFGRQAAIDTLANAVSKQQFVAVVGSSGSGKSSVVRAGLVPHLRRETHGSKDGEGQGGSCHSSASGNPGEALDSGSRSAVTLHGRTSPILSGINLPNFWTKLWSAPAMLALWGRKPYSRLRGCEARLRPSKAGARLPHSKEAPHG